jgi:hypothetical protein
MVEELTTLTADEQKYVDDLRRGHFDYTKCLDSEYEAKVITAVKDIAIGEFGDDCGLSVFITHGQDLQVWLDKGYYIHRPEMEEIAETIVDRIQVYFGLNFTNRSIGERSLGFIVDEEQTEYFQRYGK